MAPSKTIPEKYTDPSYWHPKAKNWTVIDWDKFDSLNPSPPRIYTPVQVKDPNVIGIDCSSILFVLNWWSQRSPVCVPCGCTWALFTCGKPARNQTGRITDDTFLKEFLDPDTSSPHTPDFLKGAFWTRDNLMVETLVAPEKWIWKSNPGSTDGPVAVASSKFGWTVPRTLWGYLYGNILAQGMVNVQVHPNGKWVAAAALSSDPTDEEGMVKWLWIYVVQEGDEFVLEDGDDDTNPTYLAPGSLLRVEWDPYDVYSTGDENLTYLYTFVPIAKMKNGGGDQQISSYQKGEDNGTLIKVQPGYDELVQKVKEDYYPGKKPMCCEWFACCMSTEQKVEYHRNTYNDLQTWAKPVPIPSSEVIDRL